MVHLPDTFLLVLVAHSVDTMEVFVEFLMGNWPTLGFAVVGMSAVGTIIKVSRDYGKYTQKVNDAIVSQQGELQAVKQTVDELKKELHNGYTCRSHALLVEKMGELVGSLETLIKHLNNN